MTQASLSENMLHSAICGMIDVTKTAQGYVVTLPQAYHSGNIVSVVVVPEADGFLVHDNSYAAMVLDKSGTPKPSALASEVAAAIRYYDCHLSAMRVWRRCETIDDIGLSAVLVGCASRLVADQALKVDKLPMYDFKAKLLGTVTDIVGLKRIRVNEEVAGHLGSRYKVSAVVLDNGLRTPVAFLEPVPDQQAVARRFKEFYDIKLNRTYSDVLRLAVTDDAKSIPAGDALLMQEVSTVVRFRDTPKMFAQWVTMQ